MINPIIEKGGAGYSGVNSCKALLQAGLMPILCDNLISEGRDAVKWGSLEVGDLEDESRFTDIIRGYNPVGGLQFTAFMEARNSVIDPIWFLKTKNGADYTRRCPAPY